MPDEEANNPHPARKRYSQPWTVAGRELFGYWLPFFGFRDAVPPAEMTVTKDLRGPQPALMLRWFGCGFQMFIRRPPKGENKRR